MLQRLCEKLDQIFNQYAQAIKVICISLRISEECSWHNGITASLHCRL